MTKVLESDAITVGGYDRLTFAVSAGAQFAVDDIVLGVDDPETVVYTHNAANELLAMDGPAALARFDYDAWGRTVTKRRVSGAATHRAVYGYRFGQRLKSVQTDIPREQSADYNYDGLGKRRNKVIDGDATWFRWDAGWNMIAEYDGGANQLDWDPGDLAMTYVPGLAQVPGTNPATGAYGYFAADHLGSTRGVYNQSKAMTAALEYAPYGEPRAWRGDAPAPTYTGHYRDAESGLYFAPYRYYLPDAGRWLTRDPLGMVDGPNVYAYVGGRPGNWKDSLGLLRDCDKEHRDNFRRCYNSKPPWPCKYKDGCHYRYCQAKSLGEYMLCLADNASERICDIVNYPIPIPDPGPGIPLPSCPVPWFCDENGTTGKVLSLHNIANGDTL